MNHHSHNRASGGNYQKKANCHKILLHLDHLQELIANSSVLLEDTSII